MSRSALSRPLAMALADSVLTAGHSVFDYGCGRGDDVRNLVSLGFGAQGWDPRFRPDTEQLAADLVNLGYVVNVIEDRRERVDALQRAWALTRRVLVVSGRLTWELRDLVGRPHGDGVLTRSGTFQKFYEQSELMSWIGEVLGVEPIAAAPGIFYVFRETEDAQAFLSTRAYSYRRRVQVDPHAVFDANKDLLDPLLGFLTLHARPPRIGELPVAEMRAVQDAFGSVSRAHALIRRVTDETQWERIRIERKNELLIYIAMSRFGGRPRFNQLPAVLAGDIRAIFGSYQAASAQADRLLLACGDPALILVAARASEVGKQTPTALYVHWTALARLPPVLRVYEACARVLTGTVEDANMIKLCVSRPQVSYLAYPHFDTDAHPTLGGATTVNLRSLKVDWRDYARSRNPPLLHRKEEFVGPDDPRRPLYQRLTRAEMRAGLYEHPERIGMLRGWEATLAAAGVTVRGHRLVRSGQRRGAPHSAQVQ